MKATLIVALAIVIVGIRVWRHRYARKKLGTPPGSPDRSPHGTRVRGDVELIVRREVHERLTTRVFRIGTLVILLGVAAAVIIPVIDKGGTPVARVGIVGSTTALVRPTLAAAGTAQGVKVTISDETSLAAAKSALRSGRVDLVLVDDCYFEVAQGISTTDTSALATYHRGPSRTISVSRKPSPDRASPPRTSARSPSRSPARRAWRSGA